MPVALLPVLSPMGAVILDFAPRFQWPLLAIGLIAGSFEEIEWTGFATPRLFSKFSIGRPGARNQSAGNEITTGDH